MPRGHGSLFPGFLRSLFCQFLICRIDKAESLDKFTKSIEILLFLSFLLFRFLLVKLHATNELGADELQEKAGNRLDRLDILGLHNEVQGYWLSSTQKVLNVEIGHRHVALHDRVLVDGKRGLRRLHDGRPRLLRAVQHVACALGDLRVG